MDYVLAILLIAVVLTYSIIGMKASRYLKREMFHVSAEFYTDFTQYWWRQLLIGFAFGFVLIPIALIHWLIVGRNR